MSVFHPFLPFELLTKSQIVTAAALFGALCV